MSEQPTTCGQGLAEHARLPAKVAQLFAAVAENLEGHLTALDASDPEHAAYRSLIARHRELVTQLAATATEMASYRDLPMGPHDEAAMAAPRIMEAFKSFIRIERELAALLQERVAAHERMLG